ncbi:MAG: FAD-dependent oxidoreductase [Hyphomicrobiaceae bacterium]
MKQPEIWDAIIVGQGIAGTTLAWRLREAGQRVLLVDACAAVTCSKIAAGLITPVTGMRLVLTTNCDALLAEARAFYADIERETAATFFHERTAVRLFRSEAERVAWEPRRLRPEYQSYLVTPGPEPLVGPELADAREGGFGMRAAQLDVAAYLAASRAVLPWVAMAVDWERDVVLGADEVRVGGHRGLRVVSCEGYAAARNPYFARVPFKAAKGDILTVRFQGSVPPQCFHRGIWIAPTAEPDVFRVGASYDWARLDQVPDEGARAEIERKLRAFWKVPYTVVAHEAAVRPIIAESKPVMGVHPGHDRLAYFNGLGSKGSLHAPWFTGVFARHLVDGAALPPDVDLGTFWR